MIVNPAKLLRENLNGTIISSFDMETISRMGDNKKQLYIPHGFAHGYSVLSETAEVFYKCDSFYNK